MNLIAYLRVSTSKQGESGLGLDAQQQAVTAYAASVGGVIVQTYTEVESGRRKDRPQLTAALAHAKRSKSRLVIAKLDRLARRVSFVSALMDSGVDFVACDNPHATRLTIHILAAVAEEEARLCSERTRAALRAAKAGGKLLGSARPGHWAGREERRRAGAMAGGAVRSRQARQASSEARHVAAEGRTAGKSLVAIADDLNARGVTAPRGGKWSKSQVLRLLRV